MISPVFGGKIEHGELILNNPQLYLAHLNSLNGEVNVTVKRRIKTRSDKQNRYYWGVVIDILWKHFALDSPIEMDEKISPEAWHIGLRNEFLTIASFPLRISKSSTSLSTVEFEEYLTQIRTWAQVKFNVYIPLPNEVDYE